MNSFKLFGYLFTKKNSVKLKDDESVIYVCEEQLYCLYLYEDGKTSILELDYLFLPAKYISHEIKIRARFIKGTWSELRNKITFIHHDEYVVSNKENIFRENKLLE